MCGIAGFAGEGTRETLERMTRSLVYRGPDGEGYFFDENFQVGMGHRRLSIIDLEGGRQPIFNEDKSVAVIFNGEIYNFLDLRKDLESRHKFLTKSDTEVIVHLYEEAGETAFEKLNGMFAIAIYDAPRRKLVLARDRFGKKPLYWGVFGKVIIFGSEIKALARHPLFKRELDLDSFNKYLNYDYVPAPGSIWKNVYKLEPASYLIWQDNKIKKSNFWNPNFAASQITFESALKELDKRINESVRSRLISDVPLGVFLSGGIDSSTIAYYAQKNSNIPIKTFSVVFDDKSFDESFYAGKTAKFLGTEHYEALFRLKDLLGLIPEISRLLDEPLADPSIFPTYLLSKFTREKVVVALGGDGGDELFAGYQTFQADRLSGFYEMIPLAVRKRVIEKIIFNLPVSNRNFSFDFKLKTFIKGFEVGKKYRHQRWLGSFGHEERAQLLRPEIQRSLKDSDEYEEIDRYLGEVKSAEWRNAALYVYLRTYLMDQVLAKVDRASMFNSLEVRAPFLDYHLVNFMNTLPYRFKFRGWKTKYILKRLMTGKLPKEIIERPKKGFGVPIGQWLRLELRDLLEYHLSEERIKDGGLFNYDYVKKIKNEHLNGKKDNRKLLWNLLVFQMWREKWYK